MRYCICKCKNKSSKKNEKGITLIALVISIIVMMVLASVSLNATIGDNGIITRAQESKLKKEEADVETEILSGVAALDTEYYEKVSADSGVTINNIYNISSLSKYVNGKINGFKYNKNGTSLVYFTNSNGSYTVKFDKDGNAQTYKGIYVDKYDTIQISMDKNDTIDLATDDDNVIWIDMSNKVPLDNNSFTKNNNGTSIIKGFKNKGGDKEELVATVIIKDNGVQGNETIDTSDESKVVQSTKVGNKATAYLVKNDNEKYTLDIKGNGKIDDRPLTVSVPNESENENIEKIVIEDGIKEIGGMNFVNYKNVTEVVLPESIEKIAGGAFIGMTKLETLYYNSKNAVIEPTYKFENGKIYIVSNFNGTKLKKVIFGDNVEKIGNRAFFGTMLENIILNDNVTEIGEQAFSYCLYADNIYLGNKITKIGKSAFSNCGSLERITIPESVTYIGNYAFSGCLYLKIINYNAINCQYDGFNFEKFSITPMLAVNNNVKTIKVGNKVKKIPNGIFWNCTDVETLDLGNSVEEIGALSFNNLSIQELTLPESLKKIGMWAFKGCNNIKTLYYNSIHCSTEDIYDSDGGSYYPFQSTNDKDVSKCYNIDNIIIGDKVEYLDSDIFRKCKITTITIPASMKYVAYEGGSNQSRGVNGTFYNCSFLKEIIVKKPENSLAGAPWSNVSGITVKWEP